DGITRTRSLLTYEAGENVKDLVNWNTGSRRYLQVWLVQSVGSGAGGYTFLPGTNGPQSNGIIIRAAQFQGSLAHEFGHWLNLNHTWGPTNDPEEASNCNFDDNVSDTPNTIGTLFGCNTTQVTCGSLDNVQNHMDYSSCARMFTAGQAARMQAAANSNIGGRSFYWSNENRTNTGTSDGFDPPSCTPEVDFVFTNASGCEGLEVTFDDNVWGADEDPSWTWNWSFPGGTPSSSNEQNPTVVYNSAGSYDVTLTVTTGQGSESHTVQDAVTVTSTGGGIDGPFFEGMEESAFPNNSDPSLAWQVETPGGLTWQRNTTAAFTGNASARINLRSVTEGDVNSLISPALDMSGISSADATLSFRVAHSNRTSTDHNERLRVYASRNCGETWTLRYQKSGDALNTAGGLISSTFVPDESDWRLEEVSLGTMAGDEHVLIKFEALSDRQSYLYIDDININANASTGTGISETSGIESMNIYPNPVDGTSQIEIMTSESQHVTISILNALGQQLSMQDMKLAVGTNRIGMTDAQTLKSGIYLLQLRSEKGMSTTRFVKN
ncbi:MAG: T9SS type A sorting domain-containing protein, partial [Bacteroidetes bacterium]